VNCPPTSNECRNDLAGLDLYVSIGRELELVELMRDEAGQMREAIEHTPSAKDLEELYRWNPETDEE
jgi:hypothetical protein